MTKARAALPDRRPGPTQLFRWSCHVAVILCEWQATAVTAGVSQHCLESRATSVEMAREIDKSAVF